MSRFHSYLTACTTAVVALAFAVVQPARAQAVPSDSAILEIIKTRVDSGRSRGIAVGILENGKRRFISYGSAGPGRAPLDEHTIFEIGSISKTFTGLLLAEAVESGKVRLDEPVAQLLPKGVTVPSYEGRQITLVDLSTHRSGLPRIPGNFAPANPDDPYADYDAKKLYAFLSSYQLPRAPGDSAEYSNLAVGLLGHALTLEAGAESWGALVKSRITQPLGMRESFVDVPAALRARVSAGHDPRMDSVPAWHLDALSGAGALRSTASDMLTYLAAEMDTLHGPLARAIAIGRQPRAPFGRDSIALAWIVHDLGSTRSWWHNGGTGGFRSFVGFDPSRGVAVVVLSNAAVEADDIGMHLLAPTSPLQMPPVPVHRTEVALTPAQIERVVGDYALAPTFTLRVTREGDAAYVQATGQQKIRMWATSPDHFFLKEVDAQLVFALDTGGGPAKSVTLLQNGASQTAARKP
jgi:CubicO group peptidase (beta-lactamase class C family)